MNKLNQIKFRACRLSRESERIRKQINYWSKFRFICSNIKGDYRPINKENSRAIVLASLSFVDAIILFDENTPYDIVKAKGGECCNCRFS